MKLINFKKNKGFTLVEMLVAVAILSLSIAATFTAVQSGLQDSSIAKDQTAAFYLAQEAMEFIKNKRDNNALDSVSGGAKTWLSGLSEADTASNPCYFGHICTIDVTNGNITQIIGASGSSGVLYQTPNYLFTYPLSFPAPDGWKPTIFKREITFRSVATNEVEITVHMTWTSRWGQQSFNVAETLFNRQ